MNKKLIALAVAGAFAAPFAAQAADNVTIYGALNISLENATAKGATSAGRVVNSFVTGTGANFTSRNQVNCSSCALGFKGTEDLGGGMKAWFQLESTYNVDGEPGSTFGGRNSGVGLTSNWGTIMLGQWDTPYKAMTTGFGMPFYSTTTANYNAFIGSPGFTVGSSTAGSPTGGSADAAFDRRQRNSVQYWTPKYMGFSGRAAYSANEGKTTQTGATPGVNPYIYSVAGQYAANNIQAGVAFEYHKDFAGLRQIGGGTAGSFANSEDFGIKAQASYKIQGKYLVGVIYEHLDYESDRPGAAVGSLKGYDRDAYGVYGILPFGPGKIHANYLFSANGDCQAVGASCSAGGTQAQLWGIGYYYPLSKRSEVYLQYSQVENEDGQRFKQGSGPAERLTPAFGADPYSVALGIRHTF